MFKILLIISVVLKLVSGESGGFKPDQVKGKASTDESLQKNDAVTDLPRVKLSDKENKMLWLYLLQAKKKASRSALVDLFDYMNKSRVKAAAFVSRFSSLKSTAKQGFWEAMLHDEK